MKPPIGAARAGMLARQARIPNSVLYQHDAQTFNTGDATWVDSVDGADMSLTGDPQSTSLNGGNGVRSDGVDDYGQATGPETLGGQLEWGVAMTVIIDSNQPDGNVNLFGVNGSGASNAVRLYTGPNQVGEIYQQMIDGNGNTIARYTDNAYDDGAVHAVVINKTGDTASDIEIFVDDMSSPASMTIDADEAFDHTTYSQNNDMGYFNRIRDDSPDTASYFAGEFGVVEFNSDSYSQAERIDFVSRRPEV